jgi:hypothetical protein
MEQIPQSVRTQKASDVQRQRRAGTSFEPACASNRTSQASKLLEASHATPGAMFESLIPPNDKMWTIFLTIFPVNTKRGLALGAILASTTAFDLLITVLLLDSVCETVLTIFVNLFVSLSKLDETNSPTGAQTSLGVHFTYR